MPNLAGSWCAHIRERDVTTKQTKPTTQRKKEDEVRQAVMTGLVVAPSNTPDPEESLWSASAITWLGRGEPGPNEGTHERPSFSLKQR